MKIALFIFSFLSFNCAWSSDHLNLLSMNVYMLPKPIKFSMQNERTKVIVEQLAANPYNLILMQEAFTSSFRTKLAQSLINQYPYTIYLDRAESWYHIFGSGLFILSRYPFKILDKFHFAECGGFDCFASKGVVLIEVEFPDGKTYQIANTHLQAGAENGAIRMNQLAEIKHKFNKFKKPQVAQMLVGDLNIDVSDPEFATGLVAMQMSYSPLAGLIETTNARSNDCYSTPTRKLWIDHVWFDSTMRTMRPEIEVKDLSFEFENKKCPSSDHHAIVLKPAAKVVNHSKQRN